MKMPNAVRCVATLFLGFTVSFSAPAQSFVAPADKHLDLLFEGLAEDQSLRRNDSVAQTFFVFRPAGTNLAVLAYWPEARFLLRVERGEFAEPVVLNLRAAIRFVDLEKDVVATQSEIGSSNFLEAADTVIADVRKCLEGRRLTVATPPTRGFGPLDVIVLRVKPHALKYESNGTEADYDVAELRIETDGALTNVVLLVAVPAAGTALREKLAGVNRLWPEWWKELTTPENRLTLSVANLKSYLGARREKSPLAVIYTPGILDVQPKGANTPVRQ
jgi:hypothetical protein